VQIFSKMRFYRYLQEVYQELIFKVTWPTWSELQNSAIVVMIASLIIALAVFIMDYLFGINQGSTIWKGILGFIYSLL